MINHYSFVVEECADSICVFRKKQWHCLESSASVVLHISIYPSISLSLSASSLLLSVSPQPWIGVKCL